MDKVLGYINGAITLIQQDGDQFKDAAAHLVDAAGKIANKDVLGILTDLQAVSVDGAKIIADVKSIFGIQ